MVFIFGDSFRARDMLQEILLRVCCGRMRSIVHRSVCACAACILHLPMRSLVSVAPPNGGFPRPCVCAFIESCKAVEREAVVNCRAVDSERGRDARQKAPEKICCFAADRTGLPCRSSVWPTARGDVVAAWSSGFGGKDSTGEGTDLPSGRTYRFFRASSFHHRVSAGGWQGNWSGRAGDSWGRP